jgi:UDP-N-acetylglucosamine transferase subunit ALG13
MMILCLTGTNPYSFERLVSYVDQVLGSQYNVVIQLGNTKYKPHYAECFDFCERSKVIELIDKADLIITQGGYGSMTDVLNRGKKLIAVPRLIALNESQDVQKELVDYYASKNFLVSCYEIEKLERLVNQLNKNQIILNPFKSDSEIKIKNIVEDFLKRHLD